MSCEVCCGLGRYPVITRTGRELYTIPCPECFGSGLSDEEAEAKTEANIVRQKYDEAMAEKRARPTP
jgi:hypothetical protein